MINSIKTLKCPICSQYVNGEYINEHIDCNCQLYIINNSGKSIDNSLYDIHKTNSIEKTSEKSEKNVIPIECPICSQYVYEEDINIHLDSNCQLCVITNPKGPLNNFINDLNRTNSQIEIEKSLEKIVVPIKCPICNQYINESDINSHLDSNCQLHIITNTDISINNPINNGIKINEKIIESPQLMYPPGFEKTPELEKLSKAKSIPDMIKCPLCNHYVIKLYINFHLENKCQTKIDIPVENSTNNQTKSVNIASNELIINCPICNQYVNESDINEHLDSKCQSKVHSLIKNINNLENNLNNNNDNVNNLNSNDNNINNFNENNNDDDDNVNNINEKNNYDNVNNINEKNNEDNVNNINEKNDLIVNNTQNEILSDINVNNNNNEKNDLIVNNTKNEILSDINVNDINEKNDLIVNNTKNEILSDINLVKCPICNNFICVDGIKAHIYSKCKYNVYKFGIIKEHITDESIKNDDEFIKNKSSNPNNSNHIYLTSDSATKRTFKRNNRKLI